MVKINITRWRSSVKFQLWQNQVGHDEQTRNFSGKFILIFFVSIKNLSKPSPLCALSTHLQNMSGTEVWKLCMYLHTYMCPSKGFYTTSFLQMGALHTKWVNNSSTIKGFFCETPREKKFICVPTDRPGQVLTCLGHTFEQGCQIFLVTTNQNGRNIPNWQ
jgi:hypothetical protein